jgi:hypothetical protein
LFFVFCLFVLFHFSSSLCQGTGIDIAACPRSKVRLVDKKYAGVSYTFNALNCFFADLSVQGTYLNFIIC